MDQKINVTMIIDVNLSCHQSLRWWQLFLHALFNTPTNGPTDKPMDRLHHRKVSLPLRRDIRRRESGRRLVIKKVQESGCPEIPVQEMLPVHMINACKNILLGLLFAYNTFMYAYKKRCN